MLDRRVGIWHSWGQRFVIHQFIDRATIQNFLGPYIELKAPTWRSGFDFELSQKLQTVRKKSASNDHDPFIAKWCQFLSNRKKFFGIMSGNRHLQNRDIRLRKHLEHWNICTMIEPSISLLGDSFIHQAFNSLRELRRSRGWILQGVILRRESTKVINKWCSSHCRTER